MSQLRHTVTTLRISKAASNDSGGELPKRSSNRDAVLEQGQVKHRHRTSLSAVRSKLRLAGPANSAIAIKQ